MACDDIYIIDDGYLSAKEIGIHRAEILVIKEALSWIKQEGDLDRSYLICSDSKGVVQSLTGSKARDQTIWETMSALKELRDLTQINIKWVKAHDGIIGNILADALARKGAEEASKLAFSTPYIPICNKQMKKAIDKFIVEKWQTRWD